MKYRHLPVMFALAVASAWVCADTVILPVGAQGEALQDLERPQHGMTMVQVEARFGEPEQRHGPVGEPPISSWDYPQYVVYFEGDRVLRSVLKHNRRDR
ncbi:hypothetical protein [Marinimicrobium alkaliphilum]|uniref:hypothetical protein n=1 Tax=Marinimicrobium alkaliphilum TaxID=2202654 RepID=UPI0018E088C9|nr:hypothetical protein [Marinimicrobium alkaliphilum]